MRLVIAVLLATAFAIAQAPARVEVPTFPNPTCPIMGKKVSLPLYVDTEAGRFYVCCKPCYKKILADVPAAHRTGYPLVEKLANEICPVSGESIGNLAVEVTLQAYTFRVCCEGCVDGAKQHHQLALAKVTAAERSDVGNATCPVSGDPVAPNSFVVIDGAIVHLASAKHVKAVEQAPRAMLARAREIAALQPARPKHEHTPRRVDGEPGAERPAEAPAGGGGAGSGKPAAETPKPDAKRETPKPDGPKSGGGQSSSGGAPWSAGSARCG